MVIARIRGGLGNQLFQYAAALSLAWQKGVPLKLDLYTYSKNQQRKFELSALNIDVEIATRKEIHQFTGSNPLIRYLNKRENYLRCPQVFSQPHYHYYEGFFSINVPVYLSGYWQSEKYFKMYESELRQQYALRNPMSDSSLKWKKKIEACESVAVHVRRGDYASNNKYNSFFGTLVPQYYQDSVNEILQRITSSQFFIFSDDIDWCKKNLQFIPKAQFIVHDHPVGAIEDLFLMSCCRHQIIANSTFSWWGAWLNQNQNKTVIAPGQWFGRTFIDSKLPTYASRYYNTKDLLPEGWIKK